MLLFKEKKRNNMKVFTFCYLKDSGEQEESEDRKKSMSSMKLPQSMPALKLEIQNH